MLDFKIDHKDVSKYLIDTEKGIQKVMRKAVNASNKKAHIEGYKILKDKLKLEKDEYQNKKTKVKKIKMSDFRYYRDHTAHVRSSKRGIGFIRFSESKRRTHLKNIKVKRRKPVTINFDGISQNKKRFITRGNNSKQRKIRFLVNTK